MTSAYEIGMVGLGVMGRSLALNIAEHGFSVAGYDKDLTKGQALVTEGVGKPVGSAGGVEEFVRLLRPPRVIVLLVAPAAVVDAVLRDLLPHLSANDLVIDAGNSYYRDTDARGQRCAERGVRFFGMGISGGEAGARHGPSLMPGGPRDAYERVRPVLEAVAAKVDGEPCVAYLGTGSAGHYVKMVHNGIEYGLMQLLAETYDLLKRGLGLSNAELHGVYRRWNEGELSSYLLEITARIFAKKDDRSGGELIDKVRDVARQKGTGEWTSQDALDLHVPTPTLDVAVLARDLSGLTAERQAAFEALGGPRPSFGGDRAEFIQHLGHALYAASALTYAQGLHLLRHASKAYHYGLNLAEVARVWRGGCIIRSAFLEDIHAAFSAQPDLPNPIASPRVAEKLKAKVADLRAAVRTTVDLGLPAPAFMTALAYYDSLRSGWLPANLIQAQRDFFGAHTYERVDQEGTFHTRWGE